MAIHQDGRCTFVHHFFSIDDGIALGGAHLRIFSTGLLKAGPYKLCRFKNIVFESRIGTYRRNFEQFEQLFQKAVFVFFEIGMQCVHGYRFKENKYM